MLFGRKISAKVLVGIMLFCGICSRAFGNGDPTVFAEPYLTSGDALMVGALSAASRTGAFQGKDYITVKLECEAGGPDSLQIAEPIRNASVEAHIFLKDQGSGVLNETVDQLNSGQSGEFKVIPNAKSGRVFSYAEIALFGSRIRLDKIQIYHVRFSSCENGGKKTN